MTMPSDPPPGAQQPPTAASGPPPQPAGDGWTADPGPATPQGYGAPQGYDAPQGYGSPQGYGAPQGYGPPAGWGPPPGQPGPYGAPGGPVQSDDTTWALLAHLSFFVLGLIAPLVIYLVKKDSSPFVRQHAAEALNFHITVLIACIVSFVLIFVIIGIFTMLAVVIGGAVYSVLAAIAANKGQPYRYPLTLRLVS